MNLRRCRAVAPIVALLTSCCFEVVDGHSTSGGTGTGAGSGGCFDEIPTQHRPASLACPADGGGCQQDEDCPLDGGLRACSCAYYYQNPNACVTSDCLVDADCVCGYCSPSFVSCVYEGGLHGYYCHTQADTCINDGDCDAGLGCEYNPVINHWACARVGHCNG